YGTPPVVRATGGLADTVVDAADAVHGNGFVFAEPTAAALFAAIHRATTAWGKRQLWRRLQRNGMAGDVSWTHPAQRYAELYAAIIAAR
ncbi:MAG: starch synthase, partial [Rhodocyclaceae bacterium]|nr:starch synthase [Rhodocyclaceae bacterium]